MEGFGPEDREVDQDGLVSLGVQGLHRVADEAGFPTLARGEHVGEPLVPLDGADQEPVGLSLDIALAAERARRPVRIAPLSLIALLALDDRGELRLSATLSVGFEKSGTQKLELLRR